MPVVIQSVRGTANASHGCTTSARCVMPAVQVHRRREHRDLRDEQSDDDGRDDGQEDAHAGDRTSRVGVGSRRHDYDARRSRSGVASSDTGVRRRVDLGRERLEHAEHRREVRILDPGRPTRRPHEELGLGARPRLDLDRDTGRDRPRADCHLRPVQTAPVRRVATPRGRARHHGEPTRRGDHRRRRRRTARPGRPRPRRPSPGTAGLHTS